MTTLPESYRAVDPSGRFLLAAERAAAAFHVGPIAGGKEGIAAIARALFRALQETEEDDDAMMEGFGALLGLALAETLGGESLEREGRHAIRFGRYGYFDPFMAIRAALDADDPRETLALYLDQASDEASGRGAVALAYQRFEEALRGEGIPSEFEPRFPNEAAMPNGAIVSLERLISGEGDPGLVARHLARMLKREDAALSDEDRATIVYPRLVGERFLEELGEHRGRLYSEELASGLFLCFIAHYGERARFLRAEEIPDPALQRALAIARLDRHRPTLSLELEGGVISLSSRDGLDASRLLLARLEAELRARLDLKSGPVYIGVPHRDLLLASDEASPLAELTESAYARAPHRISEGLYRLNFGSLERARSAQRTESG